MGSSSDSEDLVYVGCWTKWVVHCHPHNGVKCRHYLAAVSPCPSADHIIRVRCRNYGIRDLALRLWIQYPSKEVTGIQKNHWTMHLSIVSFIIVLEFARMLFNTTPKILQSANCNAFNLLFVIITVTGIKLCTYTPVSHNIPKTAMTEWYPNDVSSQWAPRSQGRSHKR